MNLAVLIIICLSLFYATQAQPKRETAEALDCALLRKNVWVDPSLRPEGKVRFTYLIEPATKETPRALYLAFWNSSQDKGRLLIFYLEKTARGSAQVTIGNEGWIESTKGRLDIKDLQGGLYVHAHVKRKLPELKAQRATVIAIDELKKTSAVCSSPLDYFGKTDHQRDEK